MKLTLPLLNFVEAAELLAISASRLKKLARAGEIPHILLPDGEPRFDEQQLLRWLEGKTRGDADAFDLG